MVALFFSTICFLYAERTYLLQRLNAIAAKEPLDTTLALRLAVDSGGCHGYQYRMDLTEDIEKDD